MKSSLAKAEVASSIYAIHPAGEPIPPIGAEHGGGFVGAVAPFIGERQAIIIVANKADGDFAPLAWDPKYKASPGAKSFLDGLANTNSINDAKHSAAQVCRAYRADQEGDWHLPAHAVQTALLANLCPLWTEVEIFKEGGAQAYEKADYWSSTESQFGSDYAWLQDFGGGLSVYWGKSDALRVRPVRIILI